MRNLFPQILKVLETINLNCENRLQWRIMQWRKTDKHVRVLICNLNESEQLTKSLSLVTD